MLAAALAFLAATTPPAQNLAGLIHLDDYPAWAADANQQGTVAFELLVRPDGNPERCSIIVSTGFPQLDRYTCDLVRKRAKFGPTAAKNGKTPYSVYDHMVTWSLEGPRGAKLNPDIELQINEAPAGASLPLELQVAYLSNANGSVSDCGPADASVPAPPELVTLACRSLLEGPPAAIRNDANEAVDAWRSASVRFTLDPVSRSSGRSPASP